MIWTKHRKALTKVLIAIVIAWGAVFAIGIALLFRLDGTEMGKVGQFGDLFGVVNALFSGTAMIGVVAAIMLQHEEIDETRKAQVATTEALLRQVKVATLEAALEAKIGFIERLESKLEADDLTEDKRARIEGALERARRRIEEYNHALELESQVVLPKKKS